MPKVTPMGKTGSSGKLEAKLKAVEVSNTKNFNWCRDCVATSADECAHAQQAVLGEQKEILLAEIVRLREVEKAADKLAEALKLDANQENFDCPHLESPCDCAERDMGMFRRYLILRDEALEAYEKSKSQGKEGK